MAKKAKRKALGKGLGALIPSRSQAERSGRASGMPTSATVFECPVGELFPNEEQPRQGFDENKLGELTESVKTRGVIHPLIVRRHNGRFQIVAGERRWRAAKLAGLDRVPVIVKELTDSEGLELALIENIQREDLNPIEEAEAYRQLIDEHGLTQEELSKKVGKQRSSVANLLRLLKLPAEVRRFLLTGEIHMGHARAILGLASSRAQSALARRVVAQNLSVRECEELVRKGPRHSKGQGKKTRRDAYSPSEYRLIESLQRSLGTKVDLKRSKKGGKLIITYYSNEELQRIIETIESN